MRRVVARETSAVMRATALDERPYLSRQAASRASSNPLPSPAWVGLYEDHAPLEAFSAQLALVAGLDATVPSGCRAVAAPGGNVDLTTAVDRGQLVGAPPVRGGHGPYQQLQ